MTIEAFLQEATKSHTLNNSEISKEAFRNDPGLEDLVQEFAMRMASDKNQQQLEAGMIEIDPLPGFTVKSKLVEAYGDYPKDIKVFMNICHSPLVPAPPDVPDEDIRRAIHSEDNSSYKVPLSLSSPKTDVDRGRYLQR